MSSRKQPPYILVEKRPDLRRLVVDLEREVTIGVDLEADSMFHYHVKVCLLQVSTGSQTFLVDPVSLGDLSPLAPVFRDPRVRKVFHGADYDLRSLQRDFDIQVRSIFDTQIAARFLGLRELSLASLLKDKFGILLDKKYQKRDWSKRPLPAPMLEYAAQDVRHLLPLASILEEELRAKGWLSCAEEECEILSKMRLAPPEDQPLFLKFRGAGSLDARSLAVLEALLQTRIKMASQWDRPPFKILGNKTIFELAMTKPRTEGDLWATGALSPKQINTLGHSLLQGIQTAMDLPEEALPVYPQKSGKPIRAKVSKRIKALKQWRERRAGELGIDPTLLCTNLQIQSLALARPRNPKDLEGVDGMRNWQRKIFGPEICEVLKKAR
jgi:ribonuclease D